MATKLEQHLLAMAAMREQVMQWWDIRHSRLGRSMLATAKQVFSELSVEQGGGLKPFLFTTQDSSAKTAHNADVTDEWEQIVMYLLPHRLGGLNVCQWSTPGCRKLCLNTSGRLGCSTAETAKLVRSLFFQRNPFEFMVLMLSEIEKHQRRVARCGKRLVVRANGTADIMWELLEFLFEATASLTPAPQWFDYTKGLEHRSVPEHLNYYLVQSATERTNSDNVDSLYPNRNVVVVVERPNDEVPVTFWGRKTVDGDRHDLRFLDPQGGYAVLLKPKGKARAEKPRKDGFVKPLASV